MPSFGGFNSWPFTFGGGESNHEIVYNFLLGEYRRNGWDITEGGEVEIETIAEAAILSQVFDAAERGGGQLIPERMLESLPTWEEVTGSKGFGSLPQRRAIVAAKFLGYGGNSEPDIDAVARVMMGRQFVSLSYAEEAAELTFWPGINPGPPGLEWATSRSIVFIRVTKAGIAEDTFRELVATLRALLDDFLPTWMDHSVYTQDTDEDGVEGFVLGLSLLGEAAP